jgi:iduronate 2-sulfatase
MLLVTWGVGDAAAAVPSRPPAVRLNVLFIAVDDLRPALGCYGDATAITPHIDRLAGRGAIFRRAYCQQAVCSPSRLSLLTGRRPDTLRVWDLKTHFRETLPDLVTLPQYFKQHGYFTRSIGKIFHGGGAPAKDPPSWSQPALYDVTRDASTRYATPKNLAGVGLKRAATESAEVPDRAYIDGLVCEAAIEALGSLASGTRPFFLAVGFRKPHLPFSAPQKYWDLYDPLQIPLPVPASHPQAAPELALRSWQELEGYTDIPNDGRLSTETVRRLRHGYYACVSYSDAQVGRLLEELTRCRLAERTLVVLWGDHGYHLGEQGLWTKANNYELSTRVPLIVVIPGHSKPAVTSDALVELVDLYPTLVEACGLPLPRGLEGTSLLPLLQQPEQRWKTAVFSQFPRPKEHARYREAGDYMGYAIRTERYRYVEWRHGDTRQLLARELYDHESDPREARNVADQRQWARTVEILAQRLAAGWREAFPRTQEP